MPSKSAKKDWEIQQEYNLMYVAYTRAKKSLSFVDEAGFESFNNQSVKQDKILERIETKKHIDCIIYGYMPKQSISGALLFINKHLSMTASS